MKTQDEVRIQNSAITTLNYHFGYAVWPQENC